MPKVMLSENCAIKNLEITNPKLVGQPYNFEAGTPLEVAHEDMDYLFDGNERIFVKILGDVKSNVDVALKEINKTNKEKSK